MYWVKIFGVTLPLRIYNKIKVTLIGENFVILFIRLERVQRERDDLREQLKIVTDETLTAEEKAQRMDMLLKEEEARIYDVEKQLARLRETQVKFTAELQEFLY